MTTREPNVLLEDPGGASEQVQSGSGPEAHVGVPDASAPRHALEGKPLAYAHLRALPRSASSMQLERISDTLLVQAAPTAFHRICQLNLALALLEHSRLKGQGQLFLGLEHHFFEEMPDPSGSAPWPLEAADALWIVKEDVPRPQVPPSPETPRQVLVPDLCLLSAEQEAQRQLGWLQGAPQLVIELISSSTQKRALNARRTLYQNWGALEYWLVDIPARSVRMHRLQTGERMKSLTRPDALLMTPLLPEFSLELCKVFDPSMCVGDPALRRTLHSRDQALEQALKTNQELQAALADERRARARAERALASESTARDKADKRYQQENDRRIQLEALASVLQHRVEREVSQREAADLRLDVEVRTIDLLRRQLAALNATLEAERAIQRSMAQERRL